MTGFEPFPGAPVNPTQMLTEHLLAEPWNFDGIDAFQAALLPVDYRALPRRLSELGRDFAPDIVIHFGLAATAKGFRLERIARNRFSAARPDNQGFTPDDGTICTGPPTFKSGLPLDGIHAAIKAAKLPVEWSEDAGGYLCNMAMTLTLAGVVQGLRPSTSGFIHVPPVGRGRPLSETDLYRGAAIIGRATIQAFREAPVVA